MTAREQEIYDLILCIGLQPENDGAAVSAKTLARLLARLEQQNPGAAGEQQELPETVEYDGHEWVRTPHAGPTVYRCSRCSSASAWIDLNDGRRCPSAPAPPVEKKNADCPECGATMLPWRGHNTTADETVLRCAHCRTERPLGWKADKPAPPADEKPYVVCPECGGDDGEISNFGKTVVVICDRCHGTGEEPAKMRDLYEAAEGLATHGFAPPAAPEPSNKYIRWEDAGGPNECRHGYAAGIPCPHCDAAPPAAPEPGKSRGEEVAEKYCYGLTGDNRRALYRLDYALTFDEVPGLRQHLASFINAERAAAAGERQEKIAAKFEAMSREAYNKGDAELQRELRHVADTIRLMLDAAAAPAGEGSGT